MTKTHRVYSHLLEIRHAFWGRHIEATGTVPASNPLAHVDDSAP
jgi:hypothetical protein